jgi:pimeloyl-ACP methyl ester carboxylesterase
MLSEETKKKYYSAVPEKELRRYEEFLQTHTLKYLEWEGQSIRYYRCGQGPAILTFSGGHSGPQVSYDLLLGLEENFTFLVVNVSGFKKKDDFNRGLQAVLQVEGIDRFSLFGQSFSGIYAQAFFRMNHNRVKAIALANTPAHKKIKNASLRLWIVRIFPFFLFKSLIIKKLSRYQTFEAEISPEVRDKMRFKKALFREAMTLEMTRRNILNVLQVIMEFYEESPPVQDEFKAWSGKTLILTSKDDPLFKDVDLLKEQLPRTEVKVFPSGYKHVWPLVFRDDFNSLLISFFGNAP